MDPITPVAQLLETFGPWAVVVILGYAYVRKDRQLHDLHERVLAIAEDQTETNAKVGSTLDGLKEVIKAGQQRSR